MATEINAGRVAMVPKGEWSASTAYTRLDVVQYNGSSYVASQDSTGQNPSTATTYWQLLASGVDPSNYYTKNETNTKLGSKQDALVSGTNIKSINGQSVLGAGDVTIHEEQLIEKSYAPAEFSGLGRKYLQKNIVSDKNILTQAMMNDANTIYVIQYDYDLNGQSITVLSGCVLQFEGGSVRNGTLVGNGTQINASDYDVLFDGVMCSGTWNVEHVSICWYGAVRSTTSDKHDIASAFQGAMTFPCNEVYIPRGLWYVGTTLQMNKFKMLRLEGESSWFNLNENKPVKDLQARLFCDSNITMLLVDGVDINDNNGVFGIKGGIFDISLSPASSGYDKAVIEITNTLAGSSFACHGATIETAIIGRRSIAELQDGTAIKVSLPSGGYIGNLTTKCKIIQIGNGIKVDGSWENGYGWITGFNDYSSIRARKVLDIDIHSSGRIDGSYQTLVCYDGDSNDYSLAYLNGTRLEINGVFWDVFASSGTGNNIKRGARYAIEFGDNCGRLVTSKMLEYYASIGWIKNKDMMFFYDPSFEKYAKFPQNNVTGYNDLHNFFVDNSDISSLTIEAGSDDANDSNYADRVSFTNFDTVFSPYKASTKIPRITYTLSEGEDLHEDDYVKITINLASNKQFVMFGLTHRNGSFDSINVKFYSDSTLNYEAGIIPSDKKNYYNLSVMYDRVFFKDINKYANKIEITLKKPLKTVDEIIDFVGIVKYDPCKYLSSAGGDLHRPISWDGKILINPQVYESYSDLPTPSSYRAGSVCIFKDANSEKALAVYDGTNWRMVSLQWPTQPLFRNNTNGNSKNNYYFNTSSKTLKVYFESDSQWHEFDGSKNGIHRAGNVSQKPASADVIANFSYFANDLHKPIFVDKTKKNKYVEADGATAGVARSGDTASRPASTNIYVGFQYWDTDLGKMIAWNGSAWVNLDGTALA